MGDVSAGWSGEPPERGAGCTEGMELLAWGQVLQPGLNVGVRDGLHVLGVECGEVLGEEALDLALGALSPGVLIQVGITGGGEWERRGLCDRLFNEEAACGRSRVR